MCSMRNTLISLFLLVRLLGAAELSGTWKFQPPPNPQAPANRQPRETVYVFKVAGTRFTGTAQANGISDILNGVIDGNHINFDRLEQNGNLVPYKGDIEGDQLTIQMTNPPPPPPPGRGGRGPQGPTVLKRFSADTEFKLAPGMAHQLLGPYEPLKPNGLAKTPPMGWNSWNKFAAKVDDESVRAMADAIVSSGMRDAGYIYVNIDDTWEAAQRDAEGNIQSNQKFPDMKELAQYIHGKGLRLGIYSSPGPLTCAGYIGSYNHEAQDAKTWASWGIDYLKYDWCSASQVYHPGEMKAAYHKMAEALRATKRPIIFSLCQYGNQNVQEWGADVGGNLWRTTGDIRDTWDSMARIGFDQQMGREAYANPGHWNDPDMLEIGNGGMTDIEYQTHMSLWSILAAPLLAGNDIRSMTDSTKAILTNKEVIAIDQDKAGVQGTRVRKTGDLEVWKKPLAKGVAVGLFNRGTSSAKMEVTWSEVGIAKKSPKIRDLWEHQEIISPDSYSVEVPSHGVVMLRVE